MKESDWKIFKQIKEKALDTFCRNSLKEFGSVINNDSETAHKRYLSLYEIVHDNDKELGLVFDGHSRSKAQMQLTAMRVREIADENLVKKLSSELQESTDPKRFEW